jgi:tRNA uridine 5-carboxymethylaminomethyl modification enzyme
MFTSRAEFRILLRQDDADERLTMISYKAGLAKKERVELLEKKIKKRDSVINYLKEQSVSPDDVNEEMRKLGSSEMKQKMKSVSLIERPQIGIKDMWNLIPGLDETMKKYGVLIDDEVIESAEITIKYAGYIEREKKLAEKIKRLEKIVIPPGIDYEGLTSISTEARQKLSRIMPRTIGQASRISGVSPADISVLLVYMGR